MFLLTIEAQKEIAPNMPLMPSIPYACALYQ